MKFSAKIQEELGDYVYRLIDPRNGETFYVGKGQGNRVFDHVEDVREKLKNSQNNESESTETNQTNSKEERIKSILVEKLEVCHIIHRHKIPKDAVSHVEAAVMDSFPGLTNFQSGHKSNKTGPMSIEQIKRKYDLPEIDIGKDKILLINVKSLKENNDEEKIKEQVECAWRVDTKRAERADFVLAVQEGICIGAFKNNAWIDATESEFPRLGKDVPGRYGFKAEWLSGEELTRFCGERLGGGMLSGKRIPKKHPHDQSPIRNPISYTYE